MKILLIRFSASFLLAGFAGGHALINALDWLGSLNLTLDTELLMATSYCKPCLHKAKLIIPPGSYGARRGQGAHDEHSSDDPDGG